jgi:hypothetical protein
MADPLYTYVPIEALRALVDYADLMRSAVDYESAGDAEDYAQSDGEFRAKVAALGVPALLPDEDGNG